MLPPTASLGGASRIAAMAVAMVLGGAVWSGAAWAQATWCPSPDACTNDYNTDANWDPDTTPGSGETASFGATNEPVISLSGGTTVGGWTFNADAPNYEFTLGGGWDSRI